VKTTIIRGLPFASDAFTASSYYNMDIRHVVHESGANMFVRVQYTGTKTDNEKQMRKPRQISNMLLSSPIVLLEKLKVGFSRANVMSKLVFFFAERPIPGPSVHMSAFSVFEA